VLWPGPQYGTLFPRVADTSQRGFCTNCHQAHGWPDEALAQIVITHSTAVAMLTHDPKLDDPALLTALPSKAFYVGALGSQKTQEKRRARLREAGLAEALISRISMAPSACRWARAHPKRSP